MNNSQDRSIFLVEVDSVLEQILPDFLNNRRSDCRKIRQLLDENNFSEIRILGHRMKGAGGSYGFDHISELGEIVENASLQADREAIISAIEQLADYLERVSVVFVDD